MSGRIQHHVWKFMQIGFADNSRRSGIVWVYRKDHSTFSTNPKNHGAIRDFYTGGQEYSADDAITDFESSFAPVIGRMRSGIASDSDLARIPQLISHFEVRSRFMREHMATVARGAIEEMVDKFLDPSSFKRAAISYMKSHPDFLQKKFDEYAVPDEARVIIGKFVDVHLEAELEKIVPQGLSTLSFLLDSLRANLSDSVFEAHNRAILDTGASPEKRARFYEDMNYRVQTFPSGGLILPDTCTLFITKVGLKPAVSKEDQLEAVVLPISQRIAIIGSKRGFFSRDVPVLNSMLASVSYEAFVGASESPALESLKRKIGQNAQIFSEAEIKKAIRENTREFR